MLEIANYTETMITPLAARPSARFKANMYQTHLPLASSRGGGAGIGSDMPSSDNN